MNNKHQWKVTVFEVCDCTNSTTMNRGTWKSNFTGLLLIYLPEDVSEDNSEDVDLFPYGKGIEQMSSFLENNTLRGARGGGVAARASSALWCTGCASTNKISVPKFSTIVCGEDEYVSEKKEDMQRKNPKECGEKISKIRGKVPSGSENDERKRKRAGNNDENGTVSNETTNLPPEVPFGRENDERRWKRTIIEQKRRKRKPTALTKVTYHLR
ncbi:hypothetical protein M9H77_29909 [Catharanthus roseus]|uniref:Uncharacterized protein n=1 Tax=Catharanthus roseus TaxID=4058 RepID=A0ACB9ZVQ6_CATRO|nr:hypothetical protein M9H77_29909 [Catharanthus roseus]